LRYAVLLAFKVSNQRNDIKPLVITQPEGPSFAIKGNRLTWQKWHLVVGFNAREGLTLHDIRYFDKNSDRPIIYRASLTEMVVPYGDPKPSQRRKNAFDVSYRKCI
jgi:primary-amine oxidase